MAIHRCFICLVAHHNWLHGFFVPWKHCGASVRSIHTFVVTLVQVSRPKQIDSHPGMVNHIRAPTSKLSTTVEEPPSSNERSHKKSEHDPSVGSGVSSSAKNDDCNTSPDWHPVSSVLGSLRRLESWFPGPRQPTRRQSHRHTNRDSIRD